MNEERDPVAWAGYLEWLRAGRPTDANNRPVVPTADPLAALIAERDELAAKVAAVRELHAPWTDPNGGGHLCEQCDSHEWPCPTRRALGDQQ